MHYLITPDVASITFLITLDGKVASHAYIFGVGGAGNARKKTLVHS